MYLIDPVNQNCNFQLVAYFLSFFKEKFQLNGGAAKRKDGDMATLRIHLVVFYSP